MRLWGRRMRLVERGGWAVGKRAIVCSSLRPDRHDLTVGEGGCERGTRSVSRYPPSLHAYVSSIRSVVFLSFY